MTMYIPIKYKIQPNEQAPDSILRFCTNAKGSMMCNDMILYIAGILMYFQLHYIF